MHLLLRTVILLVMGLAVSAASRASGNLSAHDPSTILSFRTSASAFCDSFSVSEFPAMSIAKRRPSIPSNTPPSLLRTPGEGGKGKGDDDDNQGDKEEHASSSQMVHREHHVIHNVSPTFVSAEVGCYLMGSLKGEGDEADKRWRASLSQHALLSRE